MLSGGVGSRLWPVSRELYPKQFLPLADDKRTLFQQTLERLQGLPGLGEPIVLLQDPDLGLGILSQLHRRPPWTIEGQAVADGEGAEIKSRRR